jgi:hypothetical protein
MRYLWITSIGMIACSLALIGGNLIGRLEPVALICGLMLLWSGVVKIIVLRIWHSSLKLGRDSPAPARPANPSRAPGRHP